MDAYKTLPELARWAWRTHGFKKEFFDRIDGSWEAKTLDQFMERIKRLSLGLRNLGITPGEGVGILAPSSSDWLAIDIAIMIAGGVSVPIFRKISPESLAFEISDSGMRFLFLGSADEYELVGGQHVKAVPFGPGAQGLDDSFFQELLRTGAEISRGEPGLFDGLCGRVKPEDLATIVYTSGSTGLPKGVELTHHNLLSQIEAASQVFPVAEETDSALSALPLAHIFERMVVYFYLSRCVPVYFVDAIANLGALMADAKPTVITVVPRILEKVHDRISEKVSLTGGIKGLLARAALRRAETRDPEHDRIGLRDRIFKALVYGKFLHALGGRLRFLICGASALSKETARFILNIGAPLFEGYGLTEASPVIAANSPVARRLGTVGKIFPGVRVKISSEGEVLASGPGIMRGYHENTGATAEAIDPDGFLHTGDLGALDQDGFLTLTGRKKELFKKSTGEYVPPVPIEQAISRHEIVDAAMVIADRREVTTCLIFPDFERLTKYKEKAGFAAMSDAEFLESEWLRRELEEYIEEVNTHLHHCERVRDFTIIPTPISIEGGELTPTLKIRRSVIEEKYRDKIEGMYAHGRTA